MKKFGSIIILSLFIVVGCSPIYKTDYRFTTPPTEQGKMCAASCLDKQTTCNAYCKITESDCERIKELEAENDYLRYVEEQKRQKKPIEKEQWEFKSYRSCNIESCESKCAETQRICHSSCGGNVIESKYCTAFCD